MKKTFIPLMLLWVILFMSSPAFGDPRDGRQGPFSAAIRNGDAVLIDRNGFVLKQYSFFRDAKKVDTYGDRMYVLRAKNIVYVYEISSGFAVKQYVMPQTGNWIRD